MVIVLFGIVALIGLLSEPADFNDDLNLQSTTTQQIATTSQEGDDLSDTWRTFDNEQFDFVLSYPDEVVVSVEANRVVVTYVGPDAATDSEITDGFIFAVRTQPYTSDMTLEAVAEALFDEQKALHEVVASTTLASLGNEEAYQFQIESELGTTITYEVFQAGDGKVFVVDYFVDDPADRGYNRVIDQMLRSLQYEAMDDSTATTTS